MLYAEIVRLHETTELEMDASVTVYLRIDQQYLKEVIERVLAGMKAKNLSPDVAASILVEEIASTGEEWLSTY
jgi:hypothetical protein